MTNKEALEILDHNWTRLVNSDYTDIELGQAQDLAIKALEERPQGKWRNLPHKTPLRYKCSICGSFSRIKSLYCLWCGAKMEG